MVANGQSSSDRDRIPEPDFSCARHRLLNTLAFSVSDATALGLALLTTAVTQYWQDGTVLMPAWSLLLIPAWLMGGTLMGLLPSQGLGSVEELRRTAKLLLVVYSGWIAAFVLGGQGQQFSWLTFLLPPTLSAVSIPYFRICLKRILIRCGRWAIPTAVYGAGETGERVLALLRIEEGLGYDPIVAFDDDEATWGEQKAGVRVMGSAELVMPHAAVAIMVAADIPRARQTELLEGPLMHYQSVLVVPDLLKTPAMQVQVRNLSGVLGLKIQRNLTKPGVRALKRGLDISLTLVTSPLWVPLHALIALCVWLEDYSSPFFRQQRIGRDGEPFDILKFRTMAQDAEEVLDEVLQENESLRREWKQSYKLENDPRITQVGAILRRFSLDEIPQLINVLRGEMSLVGPRPLPAYHHTELSNRTRDLRERVRPGLTGMWQVVGRSDTGTAGMEKWDPYYVRNWSPWLDAVIIVRTLRAVVGGKGAY